MANAHCAIAVGVVKGGFSMVSVTGITLPAAASAYTGGTVTLTPAFTPANATDKTVTYSSDNTAVATVDAAGVVKGIKAGRAIITATAKDGGKTAKCTVNITAPSNSSTLTVTPNLSSTNVAVGGFSIVSGTVTSNFNITSVQAGIKNSGGAWLGGYPVAKTPNEKSYNLAGVDAQMLFNKLPAGSYTFVVVATDASAKTVTVTKAFTVVASNTTVTNTGPFLWPVEYHRLSSWYGYRVWKDATSSGDSYHNGIDIGCGIGTSVYAANGGKVIASEYDSSGGGEYMIIQDSNGYSTVYMHLQTRLKATGNSVKKGELIAYSGNTGGVPAHLHFEVRKTSSKNSTINPIAQYQVTDTRWNLTNPNPVYIKKDGKIVPNSQFDFNFSDTKYIGYDATKGSGNIYRDAEQVKKKAWNNANWNIF